MSCFVKHDHTVQFPYNPPELWAQIASQKAAVCFELSLKTGDLCISEDLFHDLWFTFGVFQFKPTRSTRDVPVACPAASRLSNTRTACWPLRVSPLEASLPVYQARKCLQRSSCQLASLRSPVVTPSSQLVLQTSEARKDQSPYSTPQMASKLAWPHQRRIWLRRRARFKEQQQCQALLKARNQHIMEQHDIAKQLLASSLAEQRQMADELSQLAGSCSSCTTSSSSILHGGLPHLILSRACSSRLKFHEEMRPPFRWKPLAQSLFKRLKTQHACAATCLPRSVR